MRPRWWMVLRIRPCFCHVCLISSCRVHNGLPSVDPPRSSSAAKCGDSNPHTNQRQHFCLLVNYEAVGCHARLSQTCRISSPIHSKYLITSCLPITMHTMHVAVEEASESARADAPPQELGAYPLGAWSNTEVGAAPSQPPTLAEELLARVQRVLFVRGAPQSPTLAPTPTPTPRASTAPPAFYAPDDGVVTKSL